jgi:hypothetical protein
MKIAFINVNNPQDKEARSGVPYSIYHELEKEFDVRWIKSEITGGYAVLHLIVKVYERILRWLGYTPIHNPFRAWLKSRSIEYKLREQRFDAIFSTDSEDIACLKVDIPIFYRTDALVHLMIDYYYYNVPKFAQKCAKSVEEHALQNVSMLFAKVQENTFCHLTVMTKSLQLI